LARLAGIWAFAREVWGNDEDTREFRDANAEDEACRRAAKAAALDHIDDYDDYASDSVYSKDLEEVVVEIEILSAAPAPELTGGRPVSAGVWLLSQAEPAIRVAPAGPDLLLTRACREAR
jgi:hypothetical protein